MFIEAHLALASQFCSGQFLATHANFSIGNRGEMRQLWTETIINLYHKGTIANGGRRGHRGHRGHDGHDSRQHCNTAHSLDPLFLDYVTINIDAYLVFL